jgi:hypothetical protein
LRDIVACLRSQERKLYHFGIRGKISRSTLADANESRDWRIYADFAQGLIAEARRLYLHEDLGIELANTVYALDSTTIDLCIALFPWAYFKPTQHALKLHTLLDLRGRIPVFLRITPARVHDVNILDQLGSGSRRLLCHPSSQELSLRPAYLPSGRQDPGRRVRSNLSLCGGFIRPKVILIPSVASATGTPCKKDGWYF